MNKLAKNLKPGVYQARIWEHNKHPSLLVAVPHVLFEPGCRVMSAATGPVHLYEWLTIFASDHKLYDVKRLL
jgi:hypothetical protein